VDRSALTPAQLDVIDGLMALGGSRPSFDPDLALRLLDELEEGLAPVFEHLGPVELTLNKGVLAQVHACESHYLAESDTPFEWSVASCRGKISHLAEVRSAACDVLTKFQECFPPLAPAWRPRLESSCRVELGGGSVVLRGKVDLALGRPVGYEARVLIVDVKTGRPYPTHLDDLRFYALLEALRAKVPPFRVASYYLESARWQAEDITEDLLRVAARRVIGGVTKLAQLRLGVRAPTVNPGPACSYCKLRDSCPGAIEWAESRDEMLND